VTAPVDYRSNDDDNFRWARFPFREGDLVVSTRSKHGTTWMQMILALLVHRTPLLPAPLAELSPWLDHLVEPLDTVLGRLERQPHRRIVKTHTPLDGLPIDPRATYVVVARHPLDAAVSMYHHSANMDRRRVAELTGLPQPDADRPLPPLRDWLLAWIESTATPQQALESPAGAFWHLGDAWSRRAEPNVVLVRYADLLDDLDGRMRALAVRLGIAIEERRFPELVDAARFANMAARAQDLAPDRFGVLRDRRAFFRRGSAGAAREVLTETEIGRYHARARALAPPDLLTWLHGD
jgi:hypothetical protein